ncbi:MAG TPA: aldo/keto reductase [Microlunatus sp.]
MTIPTHQDFAATHLVGGQDRVQRLGYGAMQLAGPGVIGLPEDVTGAIKILRQAVDRGVRFFDTANAYGPRTVNQLIGRALSPFADDVIIGNKVGAWRGPSGEWLTDSRPETVRTQVEDALLDLRTESSGLTYLRLWGDSQAPGNAPAENVPLEESLGALIELREEGKIRHIGLSGASPEMLERAQRMTTIAAVQNRFNLIDRSGIEVLAACEHDGIAFVPYLLPPRHRRPRRTRGAHAASTATRHSHVHSRSGLAASALTRDHPDPRHQIVRAPVRQRPRDGDRSTPHRQRDPSADRGRGRGFRDTEHHVDADGRRPDTSPAHIRLSWQQRTYPNAVSLRGIDRF